MSGKKAGAEKLSICLSEFFGVHIPESSLETDSINHYSYSKNAASLDKFGVVGTAILHLVSAHTSISQPSLKAEEISLAQKLILDRLSKILSDRLINSKLYKLIGFGQGATEDVRTSPLTLIGLVKTAIGVAASAECFLDVYDALSKALEDEVIAISKDSKTRLQEALQRAKLPLPIYKSVSTGPAHDPMFTSECLVSNGWKSRGAGRSRKYAEGSAAEAMLTQYFKGSEEVKLKLLKPNNLVPKQNITGAPYFNPSICKKFNIEVGYNIKPCFIPAALRKAGGWGGNYNRSLAMFGSIVLDYLVSLFFYRAADEAESNIKGAKAAAGREVLTAKSLISIITEGVDENNIPTPFRHASIDRSKEYKADCIQSLFAVSFLEALSARNINSLINSQAASLIKRKASAPNIDIYSVNRNNTSIAVERFGKLGFCYGFTKSQNQNLEAVVTHLKTGRVYVQAYFGCEEIFRLQKLDFSKKLLALIDIFEGVLPRTPQKKYHMSSFSGMCDFLFLCMTAGRKSAASSEIVEFINSEVNKYKKRYLGLPPEELRLLWDDRDSLTIVQRAELLGLIRVIDEVDVHQRDLVDLCFLPIIYDQSFQSTESKSIIDYTSTEESQANDQAEQIEQIGRLQPIKENEKEKNLPPHVSNAAESSALDKIKSYEKRFSSMSVSALESAWSLRNSLFESSEEAAILLSYLRYERGIDFERLGYGSFLYTDIIVSLELPSILENIKQPQNSKSTLSLSNGSQTLVHKGEEASAAMFKLETADTRSKVTAEIVVRPGQRKFRNELLSFYEKCCVSGCNLPMIIEAAHIAPYRGEKDNHVRNGVLLRVDIHRLFDCNYIGISPDDHRVHISNQLKNTEYEEYAGKKIEVPDAIAPSKTALKYRWQYFCENNNIPVPG